jgi:hypothetical protein
MGWSASVRAFSVGGERDLQSAMIKVLGAIGDERLGVGELILELGQRHHAPPRSTEVPALQQQTAAVGP